MAGKAVPFQNCFYRRLEIQMRLPWGTGVGDSSSEGGGATIGQTEVNEAITMRKRNLIGAALLIGLIAGAQGQHEQWSVVLPASEAKMAANFYPKRGPERIDGTWEASKTQIDALEANLSHISDLKGRGGTTGGRIEHPDRYFRQYIAVLRTGNKRIFINAFCDDITPSPIWRDHFYVILDGGSCVWYALYDPSTGSISDLEMNGVG
jgi:hypothetical protein